MNKRVLFSTATRLIKKRNKRKLNNPENILIVFGGAIGDSILFLSTLEFLVNFYSNRGIKTVFVAKDYVAAFVGSFFHDQRLAVIPISQKEYLNDHSYFASVNRNLSSYFPCLVISPQSSFFASFVAANIKKTNAIGMCLPRKENRNRKLAILESHTYDAVISFDFHKTAFENYSLFIRELCGVSFVPEIYPFKVFSSPLQKGLKRYIVFCPTTNEPAKGWEEDKYIAVINHCLEKTEFVIAVCSGKEDADFVKRNETRFSDKNRVVDFCGTLSLSQWVSLIGNALLCIGNDSSSAHISASCSVPYIAITSGFCYGVDMPYSGVSPSNPICVYSKKVTSCFDCYYRYGKRGGGNGPCQAAIKKHQKYLCVSSIQIKDVIEIADGVLSKLC